MNNCLFAPVLSGVKPATTQELGVIRPDNTTIKVDEEGVISSIGGTNNGGINYSYEEQFTGKYWVDGRPVYRKTIDLGNGPGIGTKYVDHNIENIDLRAIVNLSTFMAFPNLTHPVIYASRYEYIHVGVTKTKIRIDGTYSNYIHPMHTTVDYCKTTDINP